MRSTSSATLLALLGAVSNTLACTIPTTPLSTNITQQFSLYVQNSSLPAVHNRVLNFRPNGYDQHLVLNPQGVASGDTMYLVNGYLKFDGGGFMRNAVIDLEYNENDDTTKMFMTDRDGYAYAQFQPTYGCNPDTDELEIWMRLASRLTTPPEIGGQIGIQTAGGGDTYEVRYSPANNAKLNLATFFMVNFVVFRNGSSPALPSTTSAAPVPTASPAVLTNYDYVSCWAEPADGSRTLTTMTTAADMTNEKCATLCAGSLYMATQYSVECWCGAALGAGSAAAPESSCTNVCGGAATEICGGGRLLTLYKKKAVSASSTSSAAASSSSSSKAASSSSSSAVPSSTSKSSSSLSSSSSLLSTTTSSAAASSSSSSSKPASSSSTLSSSSSAAPSSSSTSSKPSSSSAAASSSSSSTTFKTSTIIATTSSSAPTGTTLPSVGVYSFVSCYSEPATGRALTAALTSSDTMTLEQCASDCHLYPYFGVEWSRECWCGSTLTAGAAPAALSECNYPCTGNSAQMCGGSARLSLYHNNAYVAPSQPATVGGYTSIGCMTDNGARTLSAKSTSSSTMTLETCAAFCTGYLYFGTEWSVECWCGSALAATGVAAPASECSMLCGGNSSEYCGNADRLSVYQLLA